MARMRASKRREIPELAVVELTSPKDGGRQVRALGVVVSHGERTTRTPSRSPTPRAGRSGLSVCRPATFVSGARSRALGIARRAGHRAHEARDCTTRLSRQIPLQLSAHAHIVCRLPCASSARIARRDHAHVNGNRLADRLARLRVRYPEIQLVFGDSRPHAEDWTFRFLSAALADRPVPTPTEGRHHDGLSLARDTCGNSESSTPSGGPYVSCRAGRVAGAELLEG